MRKTTIVLMLLYLTTQECGNGCLSCFGESCMICDSINGYRLTSNFECVKTGEVGCVYFQQFTSNCLKCLDNYYLSDGKCTFISTPIENCRKQFNASICDVCQQGFQLVGGVCQAIQNPISNCLVHDSADLTKCTQCSNSYILSIDQSICIQNPKRRNCEKYSLFQCVGCEQQSLLVLNSYLEKLKNALSAKNSALLYELFQFYGDEKIDFLNEQKCFTKNIDNCTTYEDIDSCAVCENDYYLKDGECFAFPEEPITDCEVYESPEICSSCKQGYHFGDDNKSTCQLNDTIADCSVYNTQSFGTECLECSANFYINGNTCIERVNKTIENCSLLSAIIDGCNTCAEGFIKTVDNLECRPAIPECNTYQQTASGTNLICQECNDFNYLTNNTCRLGSQVNCSKYLNQNECRQCINGYYLNNSLQCAVRNVVFDNCQEFDVNVPDSCQQCNERSFLLNKTSGCQKIQETQFCNTYSSASECSECEQGRQLTLEKTCTVIPEGENCLKKSNLLCFQCKQNYLLQNGQCVLPQEIDPNCQTTNLNGLNSTYQCLECKNYFLEQNFENEFLCSKNDSLQIIEFCVKYDDNQKCLLCQDNKILSSNGNACVDSCQSAETIVYGNATFNQQNGIMVKPVNISYKKCINNNTAGCLEASLNISTDELECIKCKSNYIPIQKCSGDLCFFGPNFSGSNDIGSSYPGLQCLQVQQGDEFYPNQDVPNENCEQYTFDGNGTYYCQKCIYGKSGIIRFSDDFYSVDCSQNIQNCSTERPGGAAWNTSWIKDMYNFTIPQAFSCYKCDSGIPFIHLDRKRLKKQYQLNNSENVPSAANDKDGHLIVCRQPTAAGLFMNNQQFVSFVDNCALGYYNIDKEKLSEIGNIQSSATCLACRNGFKPILDEFEFSIIECRQISNCQSDNVGWFNACKTCSNGHVYKYTNNSLSFDECIPNSKSNCYAGDQQNCSICKKGYFLNDDAVCDSIKTPNCIDFVEEYQNFDENNLQQKSLFYYYNSKGSGCVDCQGNYSSVKQNKKVCVESQYLLQQQGNFQNNTAYIKNCLIYYVNNTNNIRCRKCNNSFIVDNQNAGCHTIKNGCQVVNFNSPTQCVQCSSAFTLVGGNCLSNSITNCLSYQQNTNSLQCTKCQNEYYLSNNRCFLGSISNCQVYTNQNTCQQCKDGFLLFNGQSSQCTPLTGECLQHVYVDNNTIECRKCQSGFILTENNDFFNENICAPVKTILNCKTYNVNLTIQNSNFLCSECNQGFYLNQTSDFCLTRVNLDINCQKYFTQTDSCQICKVGYKLENKKCVQIISGIKNCSIYQNETTCLECLKDFILKNSTTCEKVLQTNLIANCFLYDTNNDCIQCDANYSLFKRTVDQQKNECIQNIVTNCQKVQAANVCEICEQNFYPDTVEVLNNELFDQKTDCFQAELTGDLLGCSIIQSKNECSICSPGFYLDSTTKLCKEVTTTIEGCQIYENADQCQRCQDGQILSADLKQCTTNTFLANKFPQCVNLVESSLPTCVVCRRGFFFNSGGICEPCYNQQSCMYCDPQKPTKCLICKPGYNSDKDGMCNINPITSNINVNDNPDLESDPLSRIFVLSFISLFI